MAIADINWILGLSIMFGLALVMTFMTFKSTKSFFTWLTIFSGFVVWSGIIELWVLVLCIIVLMIIFISNLRKRIVRM